MATLVRSFSKVNLGLRIGTTRPDGFHELATLYQTLALHDVVTVSARPLGSGETTRILLTTDHRRVPVDGRNTAWQMVERALAAMQIKAEVEIYLEKRLPVQGGMGAGSANAAATLIALEREMAEWGGAAPMLGEGQRLELAAEVGSDVPLFLVGGSVLGAGRGERVTAMPDVTLGDGLGIPCVVALPRVGVSTPAAFREWDARQAVTAEVRQELVDHGVPDSSKKAWLPSGTGEDASLTRAAAHGSLKLLSLAYSSTLATGEDGRMKLDTSGIAASLRPSGPSEMKQSRSSGDLAGNSLLTLVHTGIENDFEEVVFPHHPSLREIKRLLMGEDSSGPAIYAALSGSGSALFGLYRSESDARAAQQRVQNLGTEAILTETLTRAEYWERMFADVG